MNRALIAAIFILSIPLACASVSRRVPAPDLAALSDEGRALLKTPEEGLLNAQALLGTAQDALRTAEREVAIAEHMLDSRKSQKAIAELRFEGAQESRDADQILNARDTRSAAVVAVDSAEVQLAYREAVEDHAESVVERERRAVDVALAQLELAKFDAVALAKSLAENEKAVQRSAFTEQLASAELSKTRAETSVAGYAKKVQEAAIELPDSAPAETPVRTIAPHPRSPTEHTLLND